jgi:hypothetical protein
MPVFFQLPLGTPGIGAAIVAKLMEPQAPMKISSLALADLFSFSEFFHVASMIDKAEAKY